MRIASAFGLLWDIVRLPIIVVRLFINPKNIEPIFKLGTFRNHRSFKVSAEKIASDPGMMAMVESRYLSEDPIVVENLEKLPDGTLGREFARFIQSNQLDPDFYVERREILEDEFVYVRKRCPQTHDIWHVVIGVGPEGLGEMKISAFYAAQIRSPFNTLYVGIGLFYVLFREPERIGDFFDAVTEGWILGKNAKPLLAMRWEEMWERSLVEIRRDLNLPAQASGVAAFHAVLPDAESGSSARSQ
ncbi:MAG: hypothetical protein KC416_00825 [Myxococcales bacterium]|nr:hypothetical protein [Myxococcales bacterium]